MNKPNLDKLFFDDSSKEKDFLTAWKAGVKKAGAEFFKLKVSVEDIKDAAVKDDLRPNWVFINKAIHGYSSGTQALVALMYGIYDPSDGQALLSSMGMNYMQAFRKLDPDAQEIVTKLFANDQGW